MIFPHNYVKEENPFIISGFESYIHFYTLRETPRNDPARAESIVRPYADAGATWWIESNWTNPDLNEIKARVKEGPPSLK